MTQPHPRDVRPSYRRPGTTLAAGLRAAGLKAAGLKAAVMMAAGMIAAGMIAAACAGTSAREYAGARIEPPPAVDGTALPELTNAGTPRRLIARPGSLLMVYFGYTSCPDFCPTTMSDLAAARNRLDDPGAIEVAMVTVDPERDLDVLDEYVRSFFDDGIALGTNDPAVLAAAAAPFGAAYSVDPNPDADDDPNAAPVIVSHTTALYAVDDAGHLVLTWQYGTSVSDLTADIEQYLAERDS